MLIFHKKQKWLMLQEVHKYFKRRYYIIIIDDSAEDNPSSTVLHPVIPVKFVSHCFFLTHRCLILGLTQTTHLFRDLVSAAARVTNTRY